MFNWTIKLILFIAVLALAACGGADERKARYFEKGQDYLQQKDYEKALVEFKNVLQIDPRYAEAHYHLGKTQEGLGDYKKAYSAYAKATELDPQNISSMVGMGRIHIWARAPDKAIDYADKVLAIDAKNSEALVVRAGARFQNHQTAEALKDVRNALDIDPDHVASLALLTRIYIEQQQRDKAEMLIKNALLRQPDSEALMTLLAQLYISGEKYELASVEIQKLIDRNPQQMSYRIQKASIYMQMKDTESAEKELRKLVTDFPDNLEAKQELIRYLAQTRDLMFAQLELSSMQKNDPDNPELMLISAQLYSASSDYRKAEEIYREIIRKYDEAAAVKAQYRLALLMLGTERMEQAGSMLKELLEQHPNHVDALMLRGRMAISDGEADSAIADFRTALKEQPTSEDAMKYLAQAYVLDNQPELAQQQLQSLLQVNPLDMSARLELGGLLYRQRDYLGAIEQLSLVSKVQADNFTARDLLFKSYLQSGDHAQAATLVEEIIKMKPDQALGPYYQGLVLQDQQKNDAALERFKAALEIDPQAIEPLNMLVRTALAMEQPKLALRELDKLISRSPGHLVAYNLKGEVLASQKQYNKALAAFEKTIELKPEWWIAYRNLAGTYRLNKQLDKAIAAYRRGIDRAEHNQQLITGLAQLYQQENRIDEALALYEQALRLHPESRVMANNLALLLVEYRDDQASLDRALALVSLFAEQKDPSYLDTRGWVYYKRGDYDSALAALQQADELAPNQLIIHYHLGSVYFSKGDNGQARRYLQTVMDSDTDFRWRDRARQMLEQIEQRQALSSN